MKNRKKSPQVKPGNKPQTYGIEDHGQVKEDMRERKGKSPQEQRRKRELNEEGLEENPPK